MRTTFNVNFYCRSSKATKSGKSPIEVSIIINGSRSMLSLPRKEDPVVFEKLITSKRMNELKEYLDLVYQKISHYQTEMMKMGIPLSASNLKYYVQNGFTDTYTIQQLFDDFFKILKSRVDVDLSPNSFRKYSFARKLFLDYIDPSRDVKEINNQVITGFYTLLKSKYQSGTSGKYMTYIKTIIKYAMANNKITQDPFNAVKISKKSKPIELFTYEELRQIISKEFVSERVNKVRDLFCFAAGSGLAYCDCMLLEPNDFVIDDKVYIKKNRKKTGTPFTSILTDWAVDIAKKYNYDFSRLKISNQKVNQTLKDIQDSCNILTNLTFHKARHFYITYLIQSGVPVSTVKEIVGHSNITMTNHYTHLTVKDLIRDFNKIN